MWHVALETDGRHVRGIEHDAIGQRWCVRPLDVDEWGVWMILRSDCHPEANGRKPKFGEVAFKLRLRLENGEPLELELGKKGRDIIFGMLIADCHDSGEDEPA